ncbi:MAG: protoheme IX farnesyltransferase [Magnetovibrio sp.]|nr:protoheme IX farnesyltransferase [Magnetovibrio sp.]
MITKAISSASKKPTERNYQTPPQPRFVLQDYLLILKPRVMSLVVFTAVAGLILAPGTIELETAFISVACIALGAGASGAINMWYDKDIDHLMKRTMDRPIPAGRVAPIGALGYGFALAVLSVCIMAWRVNWAASILLSITILYYVFIYTMWLKRRTPQNIVIGGAAGAFPPMIGWTAVTGSIGFESLVLFAIIFLWTPPHSWALALFRRNDYEAAGIPMMPVVAGDRETKRQILIYTGFLLPVTLAPTILGISGVLYFLAATLLGCEFFRRVFLLWKDPGVSAAKPLFLFSILYLFAIFATLIIDKAFFFPMPASV